MNKEKSRAWFLSQDGRSPLYFYVMFDRDKNKFDEIDYKACLVKPAEADKIIYYYVEPTKYGTKEYIQKWDFLPNSAGVPLANEKALEVLEQEAPGEFQAIPTEIVLPDGGVLKDYKFIFVINRVKILNEEKSILQEEKHRTSWDMYKTYYYNRNGLSELNIAVADRIIFLGSEKLRRAVTTAKLVGLQFKDTYGGCHFFLDENGEIPEKYKR